MKLCIKCDKRETCKELCQEAERYVNQDYVYGNKTFSRHWIDDNYTSDETIWNNQYDWDNLRPDQKKATIKAMYKKGMSIRKIAEYLPITKSQIHRIIKR